MVALSMRLSLMIAQVPTLLRTIKFQQIDQVSLNIPQGISRNQ